MTRQDRILNVVFEQLELLEELATKAGDATLADELRAAMQASLERYCERQRVRLESTLLGQTTKAA